MSFCHPSIAFGAASFAFALFGTVGWGQPLFLDLAVGGRPIEKLEVFARGKTEFVFTATAENTIEPQLRADLFIAGGPLGAPLLRDTPLALRREGPAHPGVQRFAFSLELPSSPSRQGFVLRMRVQAETGGLWLPLPVVQFETVPLTWRASLVRFVEMFPCGVLGDNPQLLAIFEKAQAQGKIVVAETSTMDASVRIWFAGRLPEMPSNQATKLVWVLFSSAARDTAGAALSEHSQSNPPITIDLAVLDSLDSDPRAQETFLRALDMAAARATAASL